eukprot:jgi/Mesvir1/17280/Mv07687-RA.3
MPAMGGASSASTGILTSLPSCFPRVRLSCSGHLLPSRWARCSRVVSGAIPRHVATHRPFINGPNAVVQQRLSALGEGKSVLPLPARARNCRRSTWELVQTRATASTAPPAAVEDEAIPRQYPYAAIEAKWQKYWEDNQTFRTPDEIDTSKPKYYVLDMFPYPSGSGLHVGHPEGYTATDIMARFKRMKGFNVLHPMGWDAFGLPAEQYALETGTHPRVTTERNVARFRSQLKALGFSYDWKRELSTTDEGYYKWTQWIFLQLLRMGLAYQTEVAVNWCPALGTVLANEEVIDGLSERGSHPVIRKPMRQWMLRITAYAERLLDDLDTLDWPDSIKDMQRNWIGRSEGAEIRFAVEGRPAEETITVYTTRPDTIFGATYLVVAPEHPLVKAITREEERAKVEAYLEAAARKSDLERTELQKDKSGVDTGAFAINPATGSLIPIWVADYVLGGYGTGAIMAVPGHDERDNEFARKFGLEVIRVVEEPGAPPVLHGDAAGMAAAVSAPAYTGDGAMINSSSIVTGLSVNGKSNKEAAEAVVAWLSQKGQGVKKVNYKLRDWLFARQRYWGEPFPVYYVDGSSTPMPVPESELPLRLPETDNFQPSGDGQSPLANLTEWVNFTDPVTGKPAKRETNTMPQWAGSCWYYLRFMDPSNDKALVDRQKEKYWGQVDLYVGGAEHSVLHLLYARFWHKVLYDCGVVSSIEPFQRLVNQGMILGEMEHTAYADKDGALVAPDVAEAAPAGTYKVVKLAPTEVVKKGDGYFAASAPTVPVVSRAHKMSKSRGNVINPDDVVARYGADSLRLYEMFMGPLREVKMWSMQGVEGVFRFLGRAWRLVTVTPGGDASSEAASGCAVTEGPATAEQRRVIHKMIEKVTEEIDNMRFNTAISALMEFVNAATKWEDRPREALEPFVLCLSPMAPHLAEELWSRLGHTNTLAYIPWPVVWR